MKGAIDYIKEIRGTAEDRKTRKYIAYILLIGFLALLSYSMYLFSIGITDIKGVIDLLTAIGAVLGGLVGAVITFYFKS